MLILNFPSGQIYDAKWTNLLRFPWLTNWFSGRCSDCVLSRGMCLYKAVISVSAWLTVLPGNCLLRQEENWVLLALSREDRYWFSSHLLFLFFMEKRQATIHVCVRERFSLYLLLKWFHITSVCMLSISLYVAAEVSTRSVCTGCCFHAVAVSELTPSQQTQHLYTLHTVLWLHRNCQFEESICFYVCVHFCLNWWLYVYSVQS